MARIGLSVLLAISFLPTAAWPQGGNSTVRGSVRDQAQAVIPAATVTLTNTSTNVARTTHQQRGRDLRVPRRDSRALSPGR